MENPELFYMEELRAVVTFLSRTKCEILMLKAMAKFPLSYFWPLFCIAAASKYRRVPVWSHSVVLKLEAEFLPFWSLEKQVGKAAS